MHLPPCLPPRGVELYRKLRVPLLGMVENMSHHQCKACGHREHIFGEGGVARTAQELGLPLLGEVRVAWDVLGHLAGHAFKVHMK